MKKEPIVALKILVQRGNERKWDITSTSENLTFREKVSGAEMIVSIKEVCAIIIEKIENDIAYGDPINIPEEALEPKIID